MATIAFSRKVLTVAVLNTLDHFLNNWKETGRQKCKYKTHEVSALIWFHYRSHVLGVRHCVFIPGASTNSPTAQWNAKLLFSPPLLSQSTQNILPHCASHANVSLADWATLPLRRGDSAVGSERTREGVPKWRPSVKHRGDNRVWYRLKKGIYQTSNKSRRHKIVT